MSNQVYYVLNTYTKEVTESKFIRFDTNILNHPCLVLDYRGKELKLILQGDETSVYFGHPSTGDILTRGIRLLASLSKDELNAAYTRYRINKLLSKKELLEWDVLDAEVALASAKAKLQKLESELASLQSIEGV